ncbi:nucleoside transporter Fun26p [Trichomonascus vanleenenianus]|uniref:nucleoside transmembrane transporter FUN26 n=1 Tax=Trichomonascus vanleenenianus TaxID=2268995 RepID=UPI003EC9B5D7
MSEEADLLLDGEGGIEYDVRKPEESTLRQVLTLEYLTFLCIGVSYLWPWNSFLAATAYFNERLADSPGLRSVFPSSVMTVSTVTGTVTSLALAHRQSTSYHGRVIVGELLIAVTFIIMALSCAIPGVPSALYFLFALTAIFVSTVGTAFAQNGSFAVVNKQYSPVLTQAIMVGQGVSGVLPPAISILSATASSHSKSDVKSSAGYFLVATLFAALAFGMFVTVQQRHRQSYVRASTGVEEEQDSSAPGAKRHTSLTVLFTKLFIPSSTVFMTFCVTLVYPVFANNVESVNGMRPEYFIPTVFLIWNIGDLTGRILCGYPKLVVSNGYTMSCYAALRLIFIPAFFLTNIHGESIIASDAFYLILQLAFGITNGHLGSSAMMTAPDYVDASEKEAAGGFMTLALSLGLAAGSLTSFIFVAILD